MSVGYVDDRRRNRRVYALSASSLIGRGRRDMQKVQRPPGSVSIAIETLVVEMTNGRNRRGAFDQDDEVDRLFSRASPNPARVGCPSREVLMGLAARRGPVNSSGYAHLLDCSECYREFRQLQAGKQDHQ